jgi:CRISPR-associated protein Csb1
LEPAWGPGGVIFPPTFAPPEDNKEATATYVIDGEGDQSVCLLDSVGSQANRMEPLFGSSYPDLVPQIQIRVKERTVNLLEVGHRAADALVRSTELGREVETAFVEYENGNAVPLAKLAPTSLVFGAWDSRGSQVKVPRLIDSTIRAYGVRRLSRAAQYFTSLEPSEVEELVAEAGGKDWKKTLGKAGFLDAPSGITHGGIIASGDIVRNTVLNLVGLRGIRASSAEQQTALRRYILGLALVAITAPQDYFLRQGCLLVQSSSKPSECKLVFRDGRREEQALLLEDVEAYARSAASAFQVGSSRTVKFDPKLAQELIRKAGKEK